MRFFLLSGLLFAAAPTFAQGSWYYFKVGPSLGFQRWNNSTTTNSQLYGYHAAAGVETFSESSTSSLFAQVGYHIRGSAIRYRSSGYFDPVTGAYHDAPGGSVDFQFRNIALVLGAKKKDILGNKDAYFTFGVRGEYTIGTNLQKPDANSYYAYSFYPSSAGVNKVNYGVNLGGGYEFKFSELVGGALELSIHQDFSNQYYTAPIPNVTMFDYSTGQRTQGTLPEQSIKNTTLELSFVLRLLNKVVYTE